MSALKITLAAVAAHALTGTASVATRYLVTFLEPVQIAFLRYVLGSAFVLLIFLICRPKEKSNKPFVLKSILLGMLFFALFPFLFSSAFVHTSAARGALVIATMPVWAMILGYLSRQENMNSKRLFGITLTILGLAIALSDKLLVPSTSVSFLGELIMVSAAIIGAIYSVLSKQWMQGIPAMAYTPLAMLAGWLSLSPWAVSPELVQTLTNMSGLQLGILAFLGCFSGGLAFYLFNWVLSQTSASFATMFVCMNPITAVFLAWLLLGEELTGYFMLGFLIVIIGLVIGHSRNGNRQTI